MREESALVHDPLEVNFHYGGGGAVAFPICAGAAQLFEHLGLIPGRKVAGKPFVGVASGNSAGAMFALAWQYGRPSAVLNPLAIDQDLMRLLRLRGHWWDVLRAELMRRVYEKTLPPEGVFETAEVGRYFTLLAPEIPPNYYSVATWPKNKDRVPVVTARGLVGNTSVEGFWLGRHNQDAGIDCAWAFDRIDRRMLSVAESVRSTGALPGIMEDIEIERGGLQMRLIDGGLTAGANFIDPMISIFGKPRSSIVVIDSSHGADRDRSLSSRALEWAQDSLYALLCDECYMPLTAAESTRGCTVIKPDRMFGSIDFGKGPWPRLLAFKGAYKKAFAKVEEALPWLVDEASRSRIQRVIADMDSCVKYSIGKPARERADRLKGYLQQEGMFDINGANRLLARF
jgi:hypothetical protein